MWGRSDNIGAVCYFCFLGCFFEICLVGWWAMVGFPMRVWFSRVPTLRFCLRFCPQFFNSSAAL